uniref:TRAUB domain-containing protein n=1 Tax=Haemonchus placei TaxID=6290 RepID=A0A0N4WXQ2_HAEPC
MDTSQERFEDQFHKLLIESEEESEGQQDETAGESQQLDEDPDLKSESESFDELGMFRHPVDFYNLFLDADMMELVVTDMNRYGQRRAVKLGTSKIRRRRSTERGNSSESAFKWESSNYHECVITDASDQL